MCFIKSLCWAGLSEDTHSDTERDRETVLTSGYHPSFCGGVIPKKEKKRRKKENTYNYFFLIHCFRKKPKSNTTIQESCHTSKKDLSKY